MQEITAECLHHRKWEKNERQNISSTRIKALYMCVRMRNEDNHMSVRKLKYIIRGISLVLLLQ